MEASPRAAPGEERLNDSPLGSAPESPGIASIERQLEERLSRIYGGRSEHADVAERLLFWIDGVCYSAPLTALREALLEIPTVVRLPFSPSWLLGLFPLRTDLITLIDPRPMLAYGPEALATDALPDPLHSEQALLIGESGRLIAFMVDRISDIIASPDASAPLPEETVARLSISARYVEGAYPLMDAETAEQAIALNLGDFYKDVIDALEVWSRHA